ncbi:unnamed protein product [Closterium sp. Naga37s-1]|nr:unnamed protein product [Closterium sp. Naga37s-1]
MSACPGVLPACSIALRVNAALHSKLDRWSRWPEEDSTKSWSETEEESGIGRGKCGRVLPPRLPFPPIAALLGEVEGDERGKAREEDGGEGAQEGAAVLMATGDCGREHRAGFERCQVVRGAIAGFKHSRFHWMLQGQPFDPCTCPLCHDQLPLYVCRPAGMERHCSAENRRLTLHWAVRAMPAASSAPRLGCH